MRCRPHVALIDPDGVIVAVNESWRRVATANVLQGPDVGVGQNYLDVCDRARGDCSESAGRGVGIRRVLQGEASDFAIEYPALAHRAALVPPQGHTRGRGPAAGAVVMHVNITERKQAEAGRSEARSWSHGRAAEPHGRVVR